MPQQMTSPYKLVTNSIERSKRHRAPSFVILGPSQRCMLSPNNHDDIIINVPDSQHTACGTQRGVPAASNMQRVHRTVRNTMHNVSQRATPSPDRAAHAQQTLHNGLHDRALRDGCAFATCNVQHAPTHRCNTRRCNAQRAPMHYAACNAHRCNVHAHRCSTHRGNMQHAMCTNATWNARRCNTHRCHMLMQYTRRCIAPMQRDTDATRKRAPVQRAHRIPHGASCTACTLAAPGHSVASAHSMPRCMHPSLWQPRHAVYDERRRIVQRTPRARR
jgi:hypothetical protein